ncbi:MBOAT family protein [Methylomonas sp. AM2-LC]|uniref:MBOAT family O-acyltransferase n=1 Tax=Methylomonas sp. AM2-LC TaxID=3153301 RepID=UPI003263F53D
MIGRYRHTYSLLWLTLASVFFYGWWDIRYVVLLLCSISFNYAAGYFIGKKITQPLRNGESKIALILAIFLNLLMLGYFKYANFLMVNFNQFLDTSFSINSITLPLGISFFTFTQIAFLVDTYQGKVKEFNFIHYTLFVTYFPHLIAGPVLHHKEMMPQFAKQQVCRANMNNIATGFTIFVIGLAKKTLLADSMAEFSTPIFNAVAQGGQPMLFEAWIAALAYTFQLYFDFSAYCDMAIGLSLMLNVRLPLNFNSPYKATNIIEFWRRWHITLSRFLRDYLYIPLGGNRHGKYQRHLNLMITMLLGGLWHGAGWTFIIWGGLHGIYLIINHLWRAMKAYLQIGQGGRMFNFLSGILTFGAVVVGWVFFRADTYSSAITLLRGMLGMNGISLPSLFEEKLSSYLLNNNNVIFKGLHPLVYDLNPNAAIFFITVCCLLVWATPNIAQLFQDYHPTCEDLSSHNHSASGTPLVGLTKKVMPYYQWQPSKICAWLIGVLFCFSILELNHVSEFLYFQF